jgi:teichoic acid transport system permease protein
VWSTLVGFFRDNWRWRNQVWHLAVTEVRKEADGAILGWFWFLVSPAMYVGVLWLSLSVGLKTSSPVEQVPYVTWLAAGVVPWQFCSGMLMSGATVYQRYSYLVNRIKFPLTVISNFFTLARLLVFLFMMLLVLALMFVSGTGWSIYIVQLPLVVLVMYGFWMTWSIFAAPITAISKDFQNLVRVLGTPLFWLSGVFFDVNSVHQAWLQVIFSINPMSFFVASVRASLVDRYWIWQRPNLLWPFVGVMVVLIVLAILVQRRLATEVADAL